MNCFLLTSQRDMTILSELLSVICVVLVFSAECLHWQKQTFGDVTQICANTSNHQPTLGLSGHRTVSWRQQEDQQWPGKRSPKSMLYRWCIFRSLVLFLCFYDPASQWMLQSMKWKLNEWFSQCEDLACSSTSKTWSGSLLPEFNYINRFQFSSVKNKSISDISCWGGIQLVTI